VNNGLAVSMICLFAGVAAFVFYFYATSSTTLTNANDCVAAVTSMPLVNTTTGMGMTAAIAECK